MRGWRSGSWGDRRPTTRFAVESNRRPPREIRSEKSCSSAVSGSEVCRASRRQQEESHSVGKPLFCGLLPTLSKAQGVCCSSGRREMSISRMARRRSSFQSAGWRGSFQGSSAGRHSTRHPSQFVISVFGLMSGPNPPVTMLVAFSSRAIRGSVSRRKLLLHGAMGGWSSRMRYICSTLRDCKSAQAE